MAFRLLTETAPTNGIHNATDTMVAGLRVEMHWGSTFTGGCTIGIIGVWDGDPSAVTAAHCTVTQFETDTTRMRQGGQ